MASGRKRLFRRIILGTLVLFLCLIIFLFVFVDKFVEPILKDRIHTLIIQGSDSLYTYKLQKLKANFFSGNVEIENLEINIDSTRYQYLRDKNDLPSLTMQLTLGSGSIKGIGILSLLFGKKIRVDEISSKDAIIRLARHIKKNEIIHDRPPIWMAIRPKIESISIGKIKLDGIKMLYKNIDTSESIKIRFDRCDALFRDIQIDSASAFDTTRIGFTKAVTMIFSDIKFRTTDSTYKMKAKAVRYSSENKSLEVDSFKLQPTLDIEEAYKKASHQKDLYYITFAKVRFVNIRLDHFIYNNVIDGDSVVFTRPDLSIYNDRSTLSPDFTSKIGRYPHQQLLKASSSIIIKYLSVSDGHVDYTEKDAKTKQEGKFYIDDLSMLAQNITNDSLAIKRDQIMAAHADCNLFGKSPLNVDFKFYMDSANGRYDATGTAKNITAQQLNAISIPLANVKLNSLDLHTLHFFVRAEDFSAISDVNMEYSNLSLTLNKTNVETGETKAKKFINNMLKFVIYPQNPEPGKQPRIAVNVRRSRLTTEAFFGLIWKSILAGMEEIMLRSGEIAGG